MSHLISDTGYARSHPWSWRWFAAGPNITLAYLVLGVVCWQLAGPLWVGGAVVATLAVVTALWAHHRGPGRMPAYLTGAVVAVVVGYGASWSVAAVYFQHYSG